MPGGKEQKQELRVCLEDCIGVVWLKQRSGNRKPGKRLRKWTGSGQRTQENWAWSVPNGRTHTASD